MHQLIPTEKINKFLNLYSNECYDSIMISFTNDDILFQVIKNSSESADKKYSMNKNNFLEEEDYVVVNKTMVPFSNFKKYNGKMLYLSDETKLSLESDIGPDLVSDIESKCLLYQEWVIPGLEGTLSLNYLNGQ